MNNKSLLDASTTAEDDERCCEDFNNTDATDHFESLVALAQYVTVCDDITNATRSANNCSVSYGSSSLQSDLLERTQFENCISHIKQMEVKIHIISIAELINGCQTVSIGKTFLTNLEQLEKSRFQKAGVDINVQYGDMIESSIPVVLHSDHIPISMCEETGKPLVEFSKDFNLQDSGLELNLETSSVKHSNETRKNSRKTKVKPTDRTVQRKSPAKLRSGKSVNLIIQTEEFHQDEFNFKKIMHRLAVGDDGLRRSSSGRIVKPKKIWEDGINISVCQRPETSRITNKTGRLIEIDPSLPLMLPLAASNSDELNTHEDTASLVITPPVEMKLRKSGNTSSTNSLRQNRKPASSNRTSSKALTQSVIETSVSFELIPLSITKLKLKQSVSPNAMLPLAAEMGKSFPSKAPNIASQNEISIAGVELGPNFAASQLNSSSELPATPIPITSHPQRALPRVYSRKKIQARALIVGPHPIHQHQKEEIGKHHIEPKRAQVPSKPLVRQGKRRMSELEFDGPVRERKSSTITSSYPLSPQNSGNSIPSKEISVNNLKDFPCNLDTSQRKQTAMKIDLVRIAPRGLKNTTKSTIGQWRIRTDKNSSSKSFPSKGQDLPLEERESVFSHPVGNTHDQCAGNDIPTESEIDSQIKDYEEPAKSITARRANIIFDRPSPTRRLDLKQVTGFAEHRKENNYKREFATRRWDYSCRNLTFNTIPQHNKSIFRTELRSIRQRNPKKFQWWESISRSSGNIRFKTSLFESKCRERLNLPTIEKNPHHTESIQRFNSNNLKSINPAEKGPEVNLNFPSEVVELSNECMHSIPSLLLDVNLDRPKLLFVAKEGYPLHLVKFNGANFEKVERKETVEALLSLSIMKPVQNA